MDFRFTISRKIGFGFGLFIVAVGLVFYLTNNTLNASHEINQRITEIYSPSLKALEELDHTITRSLALIKHWAIIQSRSDDKEKRELVNLSDSLLFDKMAQIDKLASHWDSADQALKLEVFDNIERLFLVYSEIRRLLPEFESYENPLNRMEVEYHFLEGERIPVLSAAIKKDMDALTAHQQQLLRTGTEAMNSSFEKLRMYLVNIAIFVVVFGILIAVVTSRSIIRPINGLKKTLLYLGKGVYPKKRVIVTNDEVGEMAFAVNRLIHGLIKTKEFSLQVGAGNFFADYEPLSEDDELGFALLHMRDDLAESERELEQKVIERTNEVVRQKEEIEKQKEIVTELYKDLKDSINYAKRLQQAILPPDEMVKSLFVDSFVLYRPKDIVSGDFYWFKESGNKAMFAAIDCTGHGVPGAFVSLVGHNVLNQVTKVFTKPSQVLNNLNRLSYEALNSEVDEMAVRDGMDLALCTLDKESYVLEFAGAHSPVFVIRDKVLLQYEPDKFSIGSFAFGEREYQNQRVQLEPGDSVYVFSDGFVDQFGGPRGKKFLKKRFKELLLELSHMTMEDQKKKLQASLDEWQGNLEQVDDILVIGIRV